MEAEFVTVRRLLLLVDDDARSAELLARLLRDDGWDVEVACDGGKALRRLARAPIPHALVTDMRMPEVDGMSVARFARTQSPQIPIFVVTCYPELIDRETLDPQPRVFIKPVPYDELTAALRALPPLS